MIQNTDTTKYLDAHREVLKVMDTVRECMLKTIGEEDSEWTYDMVSRAVEYSYTYALRDVMTLMVCGHDIEEALDIWSKDDGAVGMQGECDNVIAEVLEEFSDYDGEEEEVE